MNYDLALEKLNAVVPNTLMETLDIKYTYVGENEVHATMPINAKVHQPAGLLHGGASIALAESLGSAASHMFIEKGQEIRGLEISANHLKSARNGFVYATAKPKHIGKSTSVWDVQITNEGDQLISQINFTAMHKDI